MAGKLHFSCKHNAPLKLAAWLSQAHSEYSDFRESCKKWSRSYQNEDAGSADSGMSIGECWSNSEILLKTGLNSVWPVTRLAFGLPKFGLWLGACSDFSILRVLLMHNQSGIGGACGFTGGSESLLSTYPSTRANGCKLILWGT